MKITGVDVYRFEARLNRTLHLSGVDLDVREGLLLSVAADDGHIGWGEASPLPGFSTESLTESQKALQTLPDSLIHRMVANDLKLLDGSLSDWCGDLILPASVQCALESAVFSLLAAQQGGSLAQLLNQESQSHVTVNGLLTRQTQDLSAEINRLRNDGYPAVKIKVGGADVPSDAELVRQVADALGPEVAIRLDANRAWSLKEAARFGEHLGEIDIEYLEEPLRDHTQLPELAQHSSLPIALDESLMSIPPDRLIPFRGLTAVIIRPTLLGGLEQAVKYILRARDAGLSAVISSAFESACGCGILCNLAAALGETGTPIGLDTVDWFGEQPVSLPWPRAAASIDTALAFSCSQSVAPDDAHGVTHV